MVVLDEEVEAPTGVRHRARGITRQEGLGGAVDGHPARQAAQLVLVLDDHLGTLSPHNGVATVGQPPFGVLQSRLDTRELTRGHHGSDVSDAEHRACCEQLARGAARTNRAAWPPVGSDHGRGSQLDQFRRALEVLGRQRVLDGKRPFAVLLVPVARPAVQRLHEIGLLVHQPGAQHVGEEVVIAIPTASVVEGDDEQVLAFQRLEHRLATALTGDRVAQRAGEQVEDRGVQQEGLRPLGLTLQDLLDQIVDDVA